MNNAYKVYKIHLGTVSFVHSILADTATPFAEINEWVTRHKLSELEEGDIVFVLWPNGDSATQWTVRCRKYLA